MLGDLAQGQLCSLIAATKFVYLHGGCGSACCILSCTKLAVCKLSSITARAQSHGIGCDGRGHCGGCGAGGDSRSDGPCLCSRLGRECSAGAKAGRLVFRDVIDRAVHGERRLLSIVGDCADGDSQQAGQDRAWKHGEGLYVDFCCLVGEESGETEGRKEDK